MKTMMAEGAPDVAAIEDTAKGLAGSAAALNSASTGSSSGRKAINRVMEFDG